MAADYPRGHSALVRSGGDVESLDWSIAQAICRYVENAGIELGPEGLLRLPRFSYAQPEIPSTLLLELAEEEPLPAACATLALLAIFSNRVTRLFWFCTRC